MWRTYELLVLSQLFIVSTLLEAFNSAHLRQKRGIEVGRLKLVNYIRVPGSVGIGNDEESLNRFKRADAGVVSNRIEKAWEEKQKNIGKLKELSLLRSDTTINLDERKGYRSLAMKWYSNWSHGPIERRRYRLEIGPRLRFGYPLSLSLPGSGRSSSRYNAGYYKDFNIAGRS